MAFQQPTRPTCLRSVHPHVDASERETSVLQSLPLATEESQTWVLFSPTADTETTTSYLSSVRESLQTPGRSRLSDLGSLQTVARSDLNSQPANSAVPQFATSPDDNDSVEDDPELDSLDSHLPEFLSIPNPYSQQDSPIPVLPTHDGLGSFRRDSTAVTAEMQQHMYAFERYNPRRVKRRRENLDLAQLQLEDERVQEMERNRRVEVWRLEQSRLLLEEIHRETRRRRHSEASSTPSGFVSPQQSVSLTSPAEVTPTATSALGTEWHDQDALGDHNTQNSEGIWSRLTRRFMQDFMGLDETVLAVLFGEALADDDELSTTPRISANGGVPHGVEGSNAASSSWELHMLEVVAKELGLLINRISTHPHPGAFSSYVRMKQVSLPYAGLPVIPEGLADDNEVGTMADEQVKVPSMPQFHPTVTQTSPIAIPRRNANPIADSVTDMNLQASSEATFTQQEWEQDLDIKMVFKYLRSRFTSRSNVSGTGTAHLATSSTQDTAAKAARVRQHHPLVGRVRQTDRRTYRIATPSSPAAIRHASSCASQSTRRSARRSSISSRHSSRHYWDIGGSIGTGSMIASAGPMGSWGEV